MSQSIRSRQSPRVTRFPRPINILLLINRYTICNGIFRATSSSLVDHETLEERVHGVVVVHFTDPGYVLVWSEDDGAACFGIDTVVFIGLAVAFVVALQEN